MMDGERRRLALRRRTERFDRLCHGLACERPTSLLAVCRLSPERIGRLRVAAAVYLSRVLRVDHVVLGEAELLARLGEAGEKLQNVTPTGMILPKRHSVLEFNLLMREFYEAVSSLGLDGVIDVWQVPMHIRIKLPEVTALNVDRPRHAPEDRHIDAWSGYSTHGVTTLIPVLGDVERNGVQFFEPVDGIEETWLHPTGRKGENPEVSGGYRPIGYRARLGDVQLVDAATLHVTSRQSGCGIRLSIDNIFVPRIPLEGTPEVIEPARRIEQERHETLLGLGQRVLFAFPDRDEDRKDSLRGAIDPTHYRIVPLDY